MGPETLLEVRDGSGDPPGRPERVEGPSVWSGTVGGPSERCRMGRGPYWRSRMGRGTI